MYLTLEEIMARVAALRIQANKLATEVGPSSDSRIVRARLFAVVEAFEPLEATLREAMDGYVESLEREI